LLEQLEQLKRRRSLHDDEARIRLLDKEVERLALSAMASERERLFNELSAACLRVRVLTAQIRAHSVCLREHSEKSADPDDAKTMMAQVLRWSAGSMPSTAPSIDDIQAARREWLRTFAEMLR
jgi:hypothetical protein